MCNCIEETGAKLKEHNVGLMFNLFGPSRLCVGTYKIDSKKRGKEPLVFASFCPFCGEKYADEMVEAALNKAEHVAA